MFWFSLPWTCRAMNQRIVWPHEVRNVGIFLFLRSFSSRGCGFFILFCDLGMVLLGRKRLRSVWNVESWRVNCSWSPHLRTWHAAKRCELWEVFAWNEAAVSSVWLWFNVSVRWLTCLSGACCTKGSRSPHLICTHAVNLPELRTSTRPSSIY